MDDTVDHENAAALAVNTTESHSAPQGYTLRSAPNPVSGSPVRSLASEDVDVFGGPGMVLPGLREPAATGLDVLRQLVRHLDARQVQAWIGRADAAAHGQAKDRIARVSDGDRLRLPLDQIWCGQTQMSFDHVRSKMLAWIDVLGGGVGLHELLGPQDFPVVIGPQGNFAVLRDGHHKLGALKGLSALVHRLLGDGTTASSPPFAELGEDLAPLARALPPPDAIDVEVHVEAERIAETDLERFWSQMADPAHFSPPVLLRSRNGGPALRVPPRYIGDLQDNPFRRLAAELAGKYKWTQQGPVFRNAPQPLWLKGPDAPDYIEFYVADVLERVCHENDFVYVVGCTIPGFLQDAFRDALLRAQSRDDVLGRVIVPLAALTRDSLSKAYRLGVSLRYDPDRPKGWSREQVPVWIGSPNDREQALAVGMNLLARGFEPGAASIRELRGQGRALIDRVSEHPHPNVWLNVGRTVEALTKLSKLAEAYGARLCRKKGHATKVEAKGAAEPLWLDLPGGSSTSALAVGWTLDLDRRGGQRSTSALRKRLIQARRHPKRPAHRALRTLPLVACGSSTSLARAVRIGRKTADVRFERTPKKKRACAVEIVVPQTKIHWLT